jgi:FAD/FMN-containing dehydrogenase
MATYLADTIQPMPYTALQSSLDAGSPPGLRNYWKSSFFDDLSDDVIAVLVAGFAPVSSPRSSVLIEGLGGVMSRVPVDATAFSQRRAAHDLLIASAWDDPGDDDRQLGWARDLFAAMDPYISGQAYVNYLGAGEADRVRAAYGATKYARLVALKDRYDPHNLFRLNQNIPPSA